MHFTEKASQILSFNKHDGRILIGCKLVESETSRAVLIHIQSRSSSVTGCSVLRCNPAGAVLAYRSFLLLSREIAKILLTGEKRNYSGDEWNAKPATRLFLARWWRDQSEGWRDAFNHRAPKAAPRLSRGSPPSKSEWDSAHTCRARCKTATMRGCVPGIASQLSRAHLRQEKCPCSFIVPTIECQ